MIGAIAGDIIGAPYEGRPIKTKKFSLFSSKSEFTDDTVLTVAVADVLLNGGDYAQTLRRYSRRYPKAGYGRNFIKWFEADDAGPNNSYGNGAAMRVAPIGWFCDSIDSVMEEAKKSAVATHNHPQAIKGAQAIAVAVFLARQKKSRKGICTHIEKQFCYNLSRKLNNIRPKYRYDVSCQGSVPESIIAFLESSSFDDAVRNAVSLGGDSDTQAAMAGCIAEAFYGGVPEAIKKQVFIRLDKNLGDVTKTFAQQYCENSSGLLAGVGSAWSGIKMKLRHLQ
jgi:ADP-ribosylglycohydrolase